jgi:hypothetical protein
MEKDQGTRKKAQDIHKKKQKINDKARKQWTIEKIQSHEARIDPLTFRIHQGLIPISGEEGEVLALAKETNTTMNALKTIKSIQRTILNTLRTSYLRMLQDNRMRRRSEGIDVHKIRYAGKDSKGT